MLISYQLLHGEALEFVSDLISPYSNGRSLRTTNQYLLNVPPKPDLDWRGAVHLLFSAPSLRRCLPLIVRFTRSVGIFKKLLKHTFILWLFSPDVFWLFVPSAVFYSMLCGGKHLSLFSACVCYVNKCLLTLLLKILLIMNYSIHEDSTENLNLFLSLCLCPSSDEEGLPNLACFVLCRCELGFIHTGSDLQPGPDSQFEPHWSGGPR